jgi:hypothetical protein
MYDDRVKAVELALRTILAEAGDRGLDVDSLCEGAMRTILAHPSNDVVLTADAVMAIEVAADALDWATPEAA